MLRSYILAAGLAFVFLSTAPASSEIAYCKDANVTVSAPDAGIANRICQAAKRAKELFGTCHLPETGQTVQIDVVSTLPDGCNAQYHCGKNQIEVLSPDLMAARRNKDGAFGFLSDADFFQSVIVHELAHASFDSLPCPFETCIRADEYIAYAMQVMSLPPDTQEVFEANSDIDRDISRDELSIITLFMSPDAFTQKAWAHLRQRPDACGFIQKLVRGTVYLDRERFDVE